MSDRDDQNNPTIRRLTEEVQRLSSRLAMAEAKLTDMDGPFGRIVLFKRGGTGNDAARQWKEQTVVGGAVTEFADGRQCQEDGSDALLLSDGASEFAVEFPDGDTHRYVPFNSAVLVDLEQDGGHDGSKTSPATWTYTVKVDGQTLAQNVELWQRENGKRVAATSGYAVITGANSVSIVAHNERRGTGACT